MEERYHLELLLEGSGLNEEKVYEELSRLGSAQVIGDEDLLKITVNTAVPWQALECCHGYGEIYDIVIEDMDRQSRGLKG